MFDLKRFREERKISQREISQKTGVAQSFISQIESGKDPMPDALVSKLKEIYHIDDISDYIKEKPKTASESPTLESQQRTIESLSRTVESLSRTIENLTQKPK